MSNNIHNLEKGDQSLEEENTKSGENLSEELEEILAEQSGLSPDREKLLEEKSSVEVKVTPEIAESIEECYEEKNSIVTELTREISDTGIFLESLKEKGWELSNGELTEKPILDESTVDKVSGVLEQRLQEYRSTEEAAEDISIRELHAILDIEEPSLQMLLKTADFLGIPLSRVEKLSSKVSRSKRNDKFDYLKSVAKSRLWSKEGYGSEDDVEERTSASENHRKSAQRGLESAIRDIQELPREARQSVEELTREDKSQDSGVIKEKLQGLDSKIDMSREEIIKLFQNSQEVINPILSAVTRGELSVEDILLLLQGSKEPAPKHGIIRKIKENLNDRISDITGWPAYSEDESEMRGWYRGLYAEPSLAGLCFSDKERGVISSFLDEAEKLGEMIGTKLNKQDILDTMDRGVIAQQEFLRERISSSDELYWHFTRGGLNIIRDHAIKSPIYNPEIVQTGEWSKSIHFVKPVNGSIDTKISYINYARGNMANKGGRAENSLGIAVVFPLGTITETTPIRCESRTINRGSLSEVSDDTIFRTEQFDIVEQYGLEKAYIIPMVDEKQRTEGQRRMSSYDIVRQQLIDQGYSEEWITEHLIRIPSEIEGKILGDRYGEAEEGARELYKWVNEEIQRRVDKKKIVPLRSRYRGLGEGLDAFGRSGSDRWSDTLVA